MYICLYKNATPKSHIFWVFALFTGNGPYDRPPSSNKIPCRPITFLNVRKFFSPSTLFNDLLQPSNDRGPGGGGPMDLLHQKGVHRWCVVSNECHLLPRTGATFWGSLCRPFPSGPITAIPPPLRRNGPLVVSTTSHHWGHPWQRRVSRVGGSRSLRPDSDLRCPSGPGSCRRLQGPQGR